MKKEIKKEIKTIDFNDVEDEIEKLSKKFNLSQIEKDKLRIEIEKTVQSLENTCSKYRPRENNKSYILANAILEAMCINNDLNEFIDSSKFKIHQYYNEVSQEELVENLFFMKEEKVNKEGNIIYDKNKDSFIKEPLRVLKCLRLLNHKQPKYALFSKNWFKDSRYEILDNDVLKFLIPSLLGYLGKHYDSTVSKYFENMDEVIKYIIKPSIYHNKLNFIEAMIVQAINEWDELTIKIHNEDEEFLIYPRQIICKKEGYRLYKVLTYERKEDDLKYEIDFDKIERIRLKDETYSDYEVKVQKTLTFEHRFQKHLNSVYTFI